MSDSTNAQPAKEAKRGRAPRRKPATGQSRVRPITLVGAFPQQIVTIRSSNLVLVNTFGRTEDGQDVLVPLLDFQLFGDDDGEQGGEDRVGTLYGALLSLESVGFLLQDMATDLEGAVALLATQCCGGVLPDPERIRYSAASLRSAATRLAAVAETLDGIAPAETVERSTAKPG